MAKKKIYISPALKEQTMALIMEYKKNHPTSKTPMADAFNATPNATDDDRLRFIRAARGLGWKVARTRGRYYENGVQIWQ